MYKFVIVSVIPLQTVLQVGSTNAAMV